MRDIQQVLNNHLDTNLDKNKDDIVQFNLHIIGFLNKRCLLEPNLSEAN